MSMNVNLNLKVKEIYSLLCQECKKKLENYLVEKVKEAIAADIVQKMLGKEERRYD